MTRTPRTNRAVAMTGLAALFSLSAAGAALAQASTTVTTTVGATTRQLAVTDLFGDPLTELTLTPGEPAPFQIRVTDTGFAVTSFVVNGTLNNLYRAETGGGYDYTSTIPSSEVTLDYATDAINTINNLLDISPDYLLSTITDIDCLEVQGVLGFTNLAAATDGICILTGGLASTLPITVTDVPIDGSIIEGVDLISIADNLLPVGIDPNDLESGVFSNADCTNGLGASDGACGVGTATSHVMLQGVPLAGALSGTLDTLLDGALSTGDIVGVVGDEVTTVTAILAALQDSGDAAVSSLGQELGEYDIADQISILNALFEVSPVALTTDNILGVTGIYASLPRLQVDPTTTTAGSYAGTLTATLVE